MKIINIKRIPEDILDSVGGKARGLYLLNKYGFTVPEGFIIIDLETEEDYIEAAKEYMHSGLGRVAVRSSATLEDGKDFSSAGQFETVLNVEGEEAFIAALKTCLQSLGNERATKYSKMFLKNQKSRMTIVVQQMIDASVAGVLFTKNPQNPKTVLIEAVKGLGEQLVSGQVSAEQYIVEDDCFEREDKVLLSDYMVKTIANGAKIAENNFKMPMDLEWAIDQNDRLNWLQARPITVTNQVTVNELDCDFDLEGNALTTCNIREVMPGAVTPLTLTTNIYALDYGIRKILYKNKCVRKLEELPPYSCLCNYYNQMFFNLTKIFLINHNCYLSSQEALELSICGKIVNMPDCLGHENDSGKIRKFFNTFSFLKYAMNCKPALKGMDKLVNKIPTVFDFNKNAVELYQQCDNNLWMLNEATFFHYWSSWYSGAQCNMLLTIKQNQFDSREELQAIMAGALTQIDNIESAQILIGMKKLAGVLKDTNPDVVKLSSNELGKYLGNCTGKDKEALEEFLNRHGHRGIKEFEFRSLPWREDLFALAASLHSVLSGKEDDSHTPKGWEEYAKEILSHDNFIGKRAFMSFIKKARKGVYSREYTKSRCVYIADYFKRAYRKIANELVNEGILPEVDLIYFLKHEEIGQLLQGKSSLVKVAIARRRLFPEQNACRFKEVFIGKPEPLKPLKIDRSVQEYVGTPVSRGIATGKARIVRSPDDANKLQPGEIMVAELTDIGWSPYYCTIAGLVTEIGSSLSHGVVVAREYSLPTVVNVNSAMSIIKDGDLIKIDGSTGKVTIIERI